LVKGGETNGFLKFNIKRLILFTSVILFLSFLSNISSSQALPISQIKEVESLRTESSKTFLNPDNSLTTYSYSGPIHYQDAFSKWQEIDNSLIFVNGFYQNKANSFKVSFDNHSLSPNLVNFKFKNKEIKFGLINLNQNLNNVFENPSDVISNLNLNSINYPNLFPNIDLKYIVLNRGVKEEIILKSPPAINKNTFLFLLSKPSDLAYKEETNGTISFIDEQTKEKLFYFTNLL